MMTIGDFMVSVGILQHYYSVFYNVLHVKKNMTGL